MLKTLTFSICLFLLPCMLHAHDKPNVVLFLVDDMGVMDTSVPFLADENGQPKSYPLNEWYCTPSMERLAAQGIRFGQFYAQSVCSPTRASIMTGQNSARHHTTNWINPSTNNRGEFGPPDWNWTGISAGETTLPRLLSAAGYRTIHVGKGHFGPFQSPATDPRSIGFDVNIAGGSIGQPGSYTGDYGAGKSHAVPGLEKYHNTGTFLSEALTLEAMDELEQTVATNQPFFLYMSHYAVHSPFNPDKRFLDHYQGKTKNARNFAGLIEGMDKSLGDIMDKLQELGVAENTLILFVGDNGSDGPLGDSQGHTSSAPLRGKKGTAYEGGTRVPFIAAWAKPDANNPLQKSWNIPPGTLVNTIGDVTDIFPTILDLTQVKNPESHVLDGISLKLRLEGKPDPAAHDYFLNHFPHGHNSSYFVSLRQGDWKLIYYFLTGGAELYNLASDPFENNDIANTQPDELEKMKQSARELLDQYGAQYPQKEGRVLKIE